MTTAAPWSYEAVKPLSDTLNEAGIPAQPFQSGGGIHTVAVYAEGTDMEDSHGQYDYLLFVGFDEDDLGADVFDAEGEHLDSDNANPGEDPVAFVRRMLAWREELTA
ncbi:MAG TPA: hypothetical protein VLA89_08765 [Gemmatimonadales bacterium]|nr:hypothetical protein [Gemmatimonadales bacterium]